MADRASAQIPTYDLYGEARAERSRFWMHCETIASRSRQHRWEIRSHRHENFFQILYIRGGTGEALFEEVRQELRPGSVVTVPPGKPHGFRFSRDMDGLVITFVAARMRALLNQLAGAGLSKPRVFMLDAATSDGRYLGETLDRLGAVLQAGRPTTLAEAHLSTALLLIRNMLDADNEADTDRDRSRLDRLTALVSAHAREHRPVSFYADALAISPTHLNRIVSSARGRAMTALLAETLVDEARRLLVFTGLSVQDVATNLGFADPAYFSRFFSHHAGVTPRSYRMSERDKLGG
ncbi:MAG TPA: helix-turn-helix domain-containing protein [Rhizobiaceae bacterium]|nr:helix-turn-helix domain-containing protein [Rhizobiaceae bacterium]